MTDRDRPEPTDPRRVRSVAVTVDDVVTALEANLRSDRGAVLRVTPPFNGRMRARLHVADVPGTYEGDARPLHFDPAELVSSVPRYPEPDETAPEFAEEYDVDEHYERHAEAVDAWRAAVGERVVDSVTAETDDGPHQIRVIPLG